MKKLLFVAVLTTSFLYASPADLFKSLGYSDTYKETLDKAVKSNKPMMLVISEKTCPWCRKLENQTLKKKNINQFVQDNFVALGLEKNDDVYPKQFTPQVVPTVVFVNPKDETIIFESYGYKPKKEFIEILTEVNALFTKDLK